MEEVFISGYCRQIDGSRTVLVEEGEADCLYPDCPYVGECPVALRISELEKAEN